MSLGPVVPPQVDETKPGPAQFFAEMHRNHCARTEAQYYANLYRTQAY